MLGETLGMYESGKGLLADALKFWSALSRSRAEDAAAHARSAYQNRYLSEFLASLYPRQTLLTKAGYTYPVAVFPAPEAQRSDPESALVLPVRRSRQSDSDLLPGSARYRALATKLGLKGYDRPCYTMRRLHIGDRFSIECELGSYLRALDTCDELAWELESQHEHLNANSPAAFEAFRHRLPLRQRVHDAVFDPILDGTHRSAAVAISTLVAFADGDQMHLLVRRRGVQSVAVHVGMVHVVPSFMFQPATVDHECEFSVTHNFYREYLEELFNRPEPEENEGDAHYFYGDNRLAYLRDLLEAGAAQLFFSGMAVNLLNLRPEICLLLLIRSPEWYRHHRASPNESERFQFNDEWMRVVQMGKSAESAVARIKYARDDATLLAAAGLRPSELVPPGAAALWLGKQVLDAVL